MSIVKLVMQAAAKSPAELAAEEARRRELARQLRLAAQELEDLRESEEEAITAARRACDEATSARVPAIAARRWCTPLVDLIGDQEPDDDDAEDWIIRDVIPRAESSLFAGPYKGGKSYAMIDLGLAIALGQPWLEGAAENTLGRPGRVLILALEDSKRRLRARLWRLARGRGATPNDPLIRENLCMSRTPVRIPDGPDLKAFRAELAEFRPDVVLIDCLARVMVGDEADAAAAKEYTAAITSLCIELGVAVCVLHHTRKPPGEERKGFRPLTLDDVRGSGDFVAAARHVSLWQVLPIQGRKVARLAVAGNLDVTVPERAIELVQEARDGREVERMVDRGEVAALLAEAREAKKGEANAKGADETRRRMTIALQLANERGSVSSATLAVVAGIPDRTAGRLVSVLVAGGQLEREHRTAPATITDEGRAFLMEGR